MSVFTVMYTYQQAQAPIRSSLLAEHRHWLGGLDKLGRIVSAGAFADSSGALLILTADSRDDLARALASDPFAHAGAIAATTINEWSPTWGPLARATGKN